MFILSFNVMSNYLGHNWFNGKIYVTHIGIYLHLFNAIIYNSIVKSTLTYGAETWKFNKNLESKLMSMEMDFLRRSTRCSRLENIRNNVIREKNEY